ncbi:MAG: alpha-1,2-fucosyltransferase [Nanoarchaeota archaeon]
MDKVSISLQGGLANNLFQIACAYSYGKKYSKELILLNQKKGIVHNSISSYRDSVLKDFYFFDTYNLSNFKGLRESQFCYNELPKIDGNIVLDGYFQSEKYFKEYKEELQNLFLSDAHISLIREKFKDILNNTTCSIHVRRGDYLNFSNIHPVQNMNYYMKAIKSMPKETVFLIFSDDIEWCKNNFPDIPEKFICIEGQKDFEDLYLMSLCNNNIIANSSFSWWGAWLNKNENKKVISPSSWFGQSANYDTRDLYCEDWIKL